MTKKDMINLLASKGGMTKGKAEEALEALFAGIGDGLAVENRVVIPGIGSLQVRTRAARQGRNPATGEAMNIPEKKIVKFSAAKSLTEKLG